MKYYTCKDFSDLVPCEYFCAYRRRGNGVCILDQFRTAFQNNPHLYKDSNELIKLYHSFKSLSEEDLPHFMKAIKIYLPHIDFDKILLLI